MHKLYCAQVTCVHRLQKQLHCYPKLGILQSWEYAPRRGNHPLFAILARFFDDFTLVDIVFAAAEKPELLAAGLHTTAYRLPCPAKDSVYEVNHGDVLDYRVSWLLNTIFATVSVPAGRAD